MKPTPRLWVATAALLFGATMPRPAAAAEGEVEQEVNGLVELVCADAKPACSELGKLSDVPVRNRIEIREALAVLRHLLGSDDKWVQTLLDTDIIASEDPKFHLVGTKPVAARGAVGRHPETGAPYLFLNSSWFDGLPSVVRLLLLVSAIHWHPLAAGEGTGPTVVERMASGDMKEIDCQVRRTVLHRVEEILGKVSKGLEGISVPTGEIRAGLTAELAANRSEQDWYRNYCGGAV